MAGWREIKAKARDKIHETFEIPAVYLVQMGNDPVRVLVRLHTKIAPQENEFTWPATSGFLEMTPKIVFRASEVAKVRPKSLTIVSATEMYRMGAAEPIREGYCRVECAEVPQEECALIVTALGAVSGEIWEGILP